MAFELALLKKQNFLQMNLLKISLDDFSVYVNPSASEKEFSGNSAKKYVKYASATKSNSIYEIYEVGYDRTRTTK